MAPVWLERDAQSKAASTSFSEKPKRCVIMGATYIRLINDKGKVKVRQSKKKATILTCFVCMVSGQTTIPRQ